MKKIIGMPLLLFLLGFASFQINESNPLIDQAKASEEILLEACLESSSHSCLYLKETDEIIRIVNPWNIAPFNSNDENEKILVSDVNGHNEKVLLERPANALEAYALVNYADGGRYLYYSGHEPTELGGAYIFGGLYGGMMRLDRMTGVNETVLTSQDTGAIYDVSSDDQWAAYETFIGKPNSQGVVYYYPTLDKKPVDFNGLILKGLHINEVRSIGHRQEFQRFGNVAFSPNSQKIAYEEEKGSHPDDRQYDVVVENVNDGSERSIFPYCNLAAEEWDAKTPWVDDQHLLIRCLKNPGEYEGEFFIIDTQNNNDKQPVEITDEMKKWNVNSLWL